VTIVDCAVYEQGHRSKEVLALEDAYEAIGDGRFVWIGLHEPTPDEFDSVAREFNLHELSVEDAINAHQRPKLEVYGDTVFVVLKTLTYDEATDDVDTGEIMIFVGDGFVVTVRHKAHTDLHPVRERLEKRQDLLRCGPGSVVHAIIDKVVDDYAPVVEAIDNDIEEVEKEVFSDSRDQPTQRIYKLSREVLETHKATAPLIEPLSKLARGDFGFVHEELATYFRDVYDHAVRTNEQVEGFRDLLHGALEANLAQVSVRQNEDMRKISAWVAIIAVPTAVAGIYGMNFDHMPELKWEYGYPAALLFMATVCTSLWRYFKKVGWL
jgi:magnesium transporter